MKKSVTETSKAAFLKAHQEGKIKTALQRVYNTIKNYDLVMNRENKGIKTKYICNILNLPINNVTARINELRYDYQLIKLSHTKNNESYYRPIHPGEQPDIREKTALEIENEMLKKQLAELTTKCEGCIFNQEP